MHRIILLAACFAATLAGQFNELAATDDGAHLYFSSTLKLAGIPEDQGESRIYRVVGGRVELFAEREPIPALPTRTFGNGDGARRPQVTADGATVGFTMQRVCPATGECVGNTDSRSDLRGRNAQVLGYGATLDLSSNGKWALLRSGPAFGRSSESILVDLTTGERRQIPYPVLGEFRAVAADGTVMVVSPNGPALLRGQSVIPLSITGAFGLRAISDDARVVLYTKFDGPPGTFPSVRLLLRNVETKTDVAVSATAEPGTLVWPMGMSADGRIVLYRTTGNSLAGEVFAFDVSARRTMQVPLAPGEFGTAGTVTGSGNAAFVVTTRGRIVKWSFAEGTLETVVPSTPSSLTPAA